MSTQTGSVQDSAPDHRLLWFAGAVGTAGAAVWAYSRRELSYWEKTKRAAGRAAGNAAEMKPWLRIGAGAAALGCATLAYRRREPKSAWRRAGERADEWASQTGRQLRPWLGVIASTAISAASVAYNAKARKPANPVADRAANAADRLAHAGTRIWRGLQAISGETGKLYPRVRKLVA